jgi:hypothetical protein
MTYYLHDDPRLPPAWAPWFSHEYINYFCVQADGAIMTLPPVEVQENPDPDNPKWPVGPKHKDIYKEEYQLTRQLDPLWSFDYEQRNGDFCPEPPPDRTIEPWKILVIYGTEPDLHPDCDLDLHKDQKFTGGSHGWRHMRFRALGKVYGMAPESFLLHVEFARKAFTSGNDYWGWRYLSRGTHYLADLGHPFHVKALPLTFFFRNILSPKKIFKTASAMHQGYEVYAERRFRQGFTPFKDALMGGSREGQKAGFDLEKELPQYMRKAESQHSAIFNFLLNHYGSDLTNIFSRVDSKSKTDLATQTNLCSAETAKVIFRASDAELAPLDKITVDVLFEVGRMFGALLKIFSR